MSRSALDGALTACRRGGRALPLPEGRRGVRVRAMENPDLARLEAALTEARADVARIRAENTRLADAYREDPSDSNREIMKRGAASLSAARDREADARAALAIIKKTGSLHGLLAEEGRVAGSIAVLIPPGISREKREDLIEAELSGKLTDAAESLGVVLAAGPMSYTKEKPGRDDEGRTVIEVAGRVEGDRLVPAVSRASKNMRT